MDARGGGARVEGGRRRRVGCGERRASTRSAGRVQVRTGGGPVGDELA
jgi:hypothetical protein